MVRVSAIVALLLGSALFGSAAGGTKLDIGAAAPAFANLPGIDNKKYSLGDFKQEVLVVCITCNHCPVAEAYEDRLIGFAKKYAAAKDAKVAFVAINVSNHADDKLDKMKVRAKEKGFNFPYLYDQSQAIARKLNARVTPEFYVFDKNRKLAYWGAMDDNLVLAKVTENYLEPAVDALLAGKAVANPKTRAFGCNVEYDE
jgi:peroxiredoxin